MSWWETTVVVCAGILTLFNLIDKVINASKSVKEPTDKLEERVALLERKMEFEVKAIFVEYDSRFGKDKQRLDSIEEGSKVTQKAILALLKHSIDGNNTKGLEEAKEELEKYLINR